MTAPVKIDTTSLLTILSVIVAVWALITPTNRLRLRFCITWWDWVIVGAVFILSNYLVFSPALIALGWYYSFGAWKWGLDSSSAVYLLLLSVAIYLYFRLKSPTLVRGKIKIFLELIESLNLTKRYDELALLVEPQLNKVISLANKPPLLVQVIDKLFQPKIDRGAILRGEMYIQQFSWRRNLQQWLRPLSNWSSNRDNTNEYAREVLLNILTSPELTHHLALAHPHLCLKLIEADNVIRSDFVDNFIDALLDAPGSRLYVELKNSQNTNGGGRLLIPDNNRLIKFFFADPDFARKNAIYRSIGEALCWRLDEDSKLAENLNKPLGSYVEIRRFSCPINSGITLFQIMVNEGIHQGLQDHLWLHYFRHFVDKILKQMAVQDEKNIMEYQTPYHFLLNRLFGIATDWAEQCFFIKDNDIPKKTLESKNFDKLYISKEATKVLGSMLEYVIPSKKLSKKSKKAILEMVVRCYVKIQQVKNFNEVASSLLEYTTTGAFNTTSASYRRRLQKVFKNMDPHLQGNARIFEQKIDFAIRLKPR
ncbi:TPA: hypothetical protein ACNUZI_002272 [Citrobacter braakii]